MKSFVFITALLLPFTLAAPTEEFVQTPVGLRPKSSVVQIPHGGSITHVGNEVHLLDANSKIVHISTHDASARVRTNHSDATPASSASVPEQTGWIAYAYWYRTGNPINSFTTNWPVPPAPVSNHGQTIFLFNSIEPASGSAILQPVLQWGPSAAGGGTYWAVANWYVSSTTTYYTSLASVSVGQTLQGIITLTSQSGSSFSYTSKFSNVGATLSLTNSPELVWATETLEAYSVTTGSDYPKGSTTFSSINLRTTSGTPSVTWSTVSDTADGITTSVTTQGATNAVVVIKYPTS